LIARARRDPRLLHNVPKEVLHTRARERLLEHFLSVVLRPGRVPPLTSRTT
jgi:hypothetical protein